MKKQLLNFFSAFSALEEQNEIVKNVLSERSNKDLFPVFQYIDQEDKGYIDLNDLKRVLSPFTPSEYDLVELTQSWSRLSHRQISYQDFIYFILPLNCFPKPINPNSHSIAHDIKYSVQRVFQKELEFIHNFSDIVYKFKFHVKKSLLLTFDLVSKGQNSFNREELRRFLNDNGVSACESTVFAMFRRLDKDRDGVVSITDFCDGFSREKPFEKIGSEKFLNVISNETRETLASTGKNSHRVSKSADKTLKRLMKGFIHHEKELDKYREEICFRADFTIKVVFSLFDKKKRQAVSELEFERGLHNFGIRTSANNIFLIYRHYDTNNDSLLTYDNFSDMLSPRSQSHKDLLRYRTTYQLSQETKSMLTQIFTLIIELEQNAERLRKQVSSQNCSLNDLFTLVDSKNTGAATVNEFREILRKYKIQPTINDLNSLVSRFDSNKDGRITFAEFFEQISPKVSRLDF